jgi:ubiquinol-cytochrome c reductase cytochrome c1 subunit
MTTKLTLGALTLSAFMAVGASMTSPASAAGDIPHIDAQRWSFGGMTGKFDRAQLQRGFQVFQEVCATCHGLKRIYFRNLAEKGGPEFPLEGVKSLAAGQKIEDGPNDDGKMFMRPGVLADRWPSPYKNEQEARATHNGAYPPDLSLITKARGVHNDVPFYLAPFKWLKDIANGYQEGGADYLYALLTGYVEAPKDKKLADGTTFKLADGMHYNKAFPGYQIAMAAPLSDGVVKYQDGSAQTVAQYSKDVTAFLHWAGDPKLEERKSTGRLAMIYILIMTLLLYLAKKRIWARVH